MNSSNAWRISESQAQLALGPLEATLDVTLPSLGLHNVRFRGAPLSPANLLAVRFAGQDARQPYVVSDCFIRGGDLVVTYAQRPTNSVRLQTYWRAVDQDDAPGCLAAIEVQVSVLTSLLDAWPALTIGSRLPTHDTAWLPCDAAELSPGCTTMPIDMPTGPTGYWRCRLSEGELSYGEMVHPMGLDRDELKTSATGSTEIEHHLFAQPLEKGVILRAQARGVLVPASSDAETIAAAYSRFLAAPLPLTA